MSEEWKELDISNLPSDILVGDYEFEVADYNGLPWAHVIEDSAMLTTIVRFLQEGDKYRYRKRQPKPPSHEEIMTKWWKDNRIWVKVVAYYPRDYYPYVFSTYNDSLAVEKSWFIGRNSADIPPEAIND